MHSESDIRHKAASNFAGGLMASRKIQSLRAPLFDREIYRNWPEMRKRIIARPLHRPPSEQGWLDLESTALVEVTSEDNTFRIESALLQQNKGGWRAAEQGVQTIRLIFDQPQRLRLISVVFEETETERTQEFTLRWSADGEVT